MRAKHVHFVGIGGAAASAAAEIAIAQGFKVSGCDADIRSSYLRNSSVPSDHLFNRHDVAHIDGVDVVAASPAAIERRSQIDEVQAANAAGLLMSWQEFVGTHLMDGSTRVCVAGTHGKTTTSSMLGHMLVQSGMEPTIIVGGIVKDWGRNSVVGSSNIFLIEADEYNNSYLHYKPNLSILNNVEYEHPEYFPDDASYFQSFRDYLGSLQFGATLIANGDDPGVRKVVDQCTEQLDANEVRVVWVLREGYSSIATLGNSSTVKWSARNLREGRMAVSVSGHIGHSSFEVNMIGEHNAQNAVMALCAAVSLGASSNTAASTMSNFAGVERRLEEIFADENVCIFDDYGHHPTEVETTLNSLRTAYPKHSIVAVIEPHMVSRMNQFGGKYVMATKSADKVIFTKTFMGREAGKQIPNILSIVDQIGKDKASYFDDFDTVANRIASLDLCQSVVVVFGAGNSPELTQKIIETRSINA
ncbi:UDP-N-acetylmuramate--L-alanine ligase [Rhodophyticola porphyridii]|uniref:UDP-N-acetylmuramate--L-alanine ligase n=1 Tax=Rhodophyticola porphyridii TaxID=1852017 RepID=A0A3L9XWD6_9RHOB|nr:Mur ligase family protein [Rhodophyticola porphyridii]RMA40602.1 hypothetical protein D9R08_18850 [Rhodophyticola porphyridii]